MNQIAPASALRRRIGAAAWVALAAGLPALSHASGPLDDRVQVLEYDAAGASSPQGARALYQRIEGAARNVCSPLDHGDLASKRTFRNCLQIVIGDAVGKVDRPDLTAVFDTKYPPIHAPHVVAAQ